MLLRRGGVPEAELERWLVASPDDFRFKVQSQEHNKPPPLPPAEADAAAQMVAKLEAEFESAAEAEPELEVESEPELEQPPEPESAALEGAGV